MFLSCSRFLLAFALVAGALPAAMLSVDPTPQTAMIGDMPSFDINVSGLGAFSAPSVSAFDVDVAFDSTVLAFNSVNFGVGLDLFAFGFNIIGVTPGPGTVNVFEVSFDFPSDLDTLQSDAFTLFSVKFDAIGPGTSSINLSVNTLGDSIGDPLQADATPGSVTVAAVPEPSTISLLLAGLGLAAVRLRRKSASRRG